MNNGNQPVFRAAMFLLWCFAGAAGRAAERVPAPFTQVLDTQTRLSSAAMADAAFGLASWKTVAEDVVDHKFVGDAVIANDKVTAVVQQVSGGIGLYARQRKLTEPCLTLMPLGAGGERAAKTKAVRILENTPSLVALEMEVEFSSGDVGALGLRLTTGQPIIELQPAGGVQEVAVTSLARFVVVPNFFGEDQVFEPTTVGFSEIPAENMLLQLSHTDVIGMTVWQGTHMIRPLEKESGSNSPCSGFRVIPAGGRGGGVPVPNRAKSGLWVAVLQGQDLWHATEILSRPADREVELLWSPPMDAKWRAAVVHPDSFTQCWLLEGPRSAAVGDSAPDGTCPCLFRSGRVVARISPQDPERTSSVAAPSGKLLFYPLDRSRSTPLTMMLPIDVLRNTVGVGPCQYLLQAEGLASSDDPTPAAVMEEVERLFGRRRDADASEEIQERLEQAVVHVGVVQARIEHYAAEVTRLQALVESQVHDASSTAPALSMMRAAFARLSPPLLEASTQTGAASSARASATALVGLIGTPNALEQVRQHGDVLRGIGAAQDRALANARHLCRVLRALAGNQIAPSLRDAIQSSVDAILAG